MKYYYASRNAYGSDSSVGFSNTWEVLVFKDRSSRDEFVDNSENISVSAINKSDIKKYIEAPKPFGGQRRAIDTRSSDGGAPFFGTIELCYQGEGINF